MKPIMAILAAAGVMGSTLTVSAQALLRDLEGSVLVNLGEGFVHGVEGQSVPTGARVMTGPSSAATIVYAPCSVVIGEAVVVTIAAEAPCGDRRGGIARAGAESGGVERGLPVGGAGSSTRFLLQAEADGDGDTAGVEVDDVIRRGAGETASGGGVGAGEAGVETAAAASVAGGGGAGATAGAVGALAVGTAAAVGIAVASSEDGADPTPISP